jgi:hypothetical protein
MPIGSANADRRGSQGNMGASRRIAESDREPIQDFTQNGPAA